jgi:hypothetical protein
VAVASGAAASGWGPAAGDTGTMDGSEDEEEKKVLAFDNETFNGGAQQ